MRGWICTGEGERRRLLQAELPFPERKPHEAIIKVSAAGLNRADLLHVRGLYPPPPGYPDMPGLEIFGTVIEAEPNSGFRPGDAVCGLLAAGGFAEYASAPAACLFPAPAGASPLEAACIPEAYAAAYYALFTKGGLSAGQTVCVHAAAGGVGTAALQLARAAGARPIGLIRKEEKRAAVTKAGAYACFRYDEDYAAAVLRATGGEGADLALDCLGKTAFDANAALLRPGGTLVSIGFLTGAKGEWNLAPLILKQLTLKGCALRGLPANEKGRLLDGMRALYYPAFAEGARPMIDSVFPFGALPEAMERMRQGAHIGNIVISVLPAEAFDALPVPPTVP